MPHSINNFDQSSTGTNLVLDCFKDDDQAQYAFNESMEQPLQGIDIFIYHSEGMEENDKSDSIYFPVTSLKALLEPDVSKFFDQDAYSNILEEQFSEQSHYRDVTEEQDSEVTLKFLITTVEENCYWGEQLEALTVLLEPLGYKAFHSMGYSQGDIRIVIYKADLGHDPKTDINHCIWDTPTYCLLTVDGDEYRLSEYLSDEYRWSRSEVFEGAKASGDFNEQVLEWLEENLSEYLS